MMTMSTRHRIEESAIMLEKNAEYFNSYSYPWYNRKLAGTFLRAARILRKTLEED